MVINQINFEIDYVFTRNKKLIEEARTTIQTKWLYDINEKEADSIRRNRKRTLFDAEDWMKGWFVPVKRFYSRDSNIVEPEDS
jgi:hypothetical protein